MQFSANISNVAVNICNAASSAGQISFTQINTLTRTYKLMDDSAKSASRAILEAVNNGSVEAVNDGGGVFKRSGMRVKGT